MTRSKIFLLALVAAFAAPALADSPAAPPPAGQGTAQKDAAEKDTTVILVGGPQYVNQDDLGRGKARFEEFRDVPQGFAFEFGRFAWTPKDKSLLFSLTAIDAAQDDQRYFLDLTNPARFSFTASYVELPRFYSSGSKTLWSGVGTGSLTLDDAFRQGAEIAAGSPTSPSASPDLKAYMDAALAGASPFDLQTKRKDLNAAIEFELARGLTLGLTGSYGRREGTKPLGFGTYIRRQALTGVPGTGRGTFWNETVEARGSELVEPLDQAITEGGVTLTWAKQGHTVKAGWFGSSFRNDITALYFDNPFEGAPGRASAAIFNPASDQEPAAPNGNNQLRGLYARSSTQLWPDNTYNRLFANASFKLGSSARLSAVLARATLKQDDPFLPYAENDQVVSSEAGQPLEYARNKPLPQASLDGEMATTQADFKATAKAGPVALRAGWRYYELEDGRPSIQFPGYSSSGDSYFRRGIGQTADGQKALYNGIGGYTRDRLSLGAAVKVGPVTLDGEYIRTAWDYEERQVEGTTDDAFKGTVRFLAAGASINAFFLTGSREYEGHYEVGLETSGVRAYDVWTRDRTQVGVDVDLPVSDQLTVDFGGSYWKDEYPGAASGFTYGYGLQDSRNGAFYAGLSWAKDAWVLGAWAGYDRYEWNSFQVTKTGLTRDYDPTNRWNRGSSDDLYWIGFEAVAPLNDDVTLRGDFNYQKFTGDWTTEQLGTPDVNSAVAYPFPELADSTVTLRASLLWEVTPKVTLEGRYWYEPYRLDDFTWDIMQPYMQGTFKQTQGSPTDIGDANVSRFLFLDSRYGDYTAHVLSAFIHVRF
jgi:hypothetical protein